MRQLTRETQRHRYDIRSLRVQKYENHGNSMDHNNFYIISFAITLERSKRLYFDSNLSNIRFITPRWQQTHSGICKQVVFCSCLPNGEEGNRWTKFVCDGAAKQVGKRTEFRNVAHKHDIDLHVTKLHHHNPSKVEGVT